MKSRRRPDLFFTPAFIDSWIGSTLIESSTFANPVFFSTPAIKVRRLFVEIYKKSRSGCQIKTEIFNPDPLGRFFKDDSVCAFRFQAKRLLKGPKATFRQRVAPLADRNKGKAGRKYVYIIKSLRLFWKEWCYVSTRISGIFIVFSPWFWFIVRDCTSHQC